MRRLAFLLAVLLPFPGSQIGAQTLLVEPGTRVRVTGCGTRNGHQEGSFDGALVHGSGLGVMIG